MHVEIEDFKTGWVGVSVGIRKHEISQFIQMIESLKCDPDQHFHLANHYEDVSGVADIEFYVQQDDIPDNVFMTGLPIKPNR